MPRRVFPAALALLAGTLGGCRQETATSVLSEARETPAPPTPAPTLAGPFVHDAAIMGSRFRVTVYAPDAATAKAAAQEAFATAQRVNDLLSDYQNDSETLRLAALPHGVPHPVSVDFSEILAYSLKLAAETDGTFDPTVGPATRLWRRARLGKPMDWNALEQARGSLGWRKVALEAEKRLVTFAAPGMRLDFGGIGKGWAADSALAVLRRRGLPHASVSASGDLAIGDPPPGKTGWTVGIESLDASGGAVSTEVLLRNCGLSTSGDTEQFLIVDGKRFSHIVDPRTGMALAERRAVSVVAPTATESDALATALCVMGPEQGRPWAEKRGIGAFFVTSPATGETRRASTAGWPSFRAAKESSRLADPAGKR